jgi:hypothetical protein
MVCLYTPDSGKELFRLKFRVFWDVALCSQVDVDRRFIGAYCLHHQALKKTKLHTRRRENLKSHSFLDCLCPCIMSKLFNEFYLYSA